MLKITHLLTLFFALFVLAVLASGAAAEPGNSPAAKANQCIGCHNDGGFRSVFPEVYPAPKITHQTAAFLEHALKSYRAGERQHPTMNAIAANLSDEDIKQLAEFFANGKQ